MTGIYFILTITDPKAAISLLRQVVNTGISTVQLRAKSGIDLKDALLIRKICKDHGVDLMVNDHVDLAIEIEAEGIHLGQTDMPICQARQYIGKHKIIGATAPTPDLIHKAINEGANYVGVGHVFPTTTKKKEGPPIGIKGIRIAVCASSIPVVAIGGLHKAALPEIFMAGASSVAVCAAIAHAANPHLAAKQLVEQWNQLFLSTSTS